ncbi:DUF2846 domain-containing protein [Aquabacterium sp. OR-4]|uniref:DUF2846 domain-containing protein n=1 Tax=Aquabacterium sp. OR-4 TaxID=2978127 RepID=UPI0021B1EA68|nr:DUF2846 domain-containing protein [Aquabacterium sp. OR-4]MDT7836030.1 DUF2846 domain-containing protein [Aquabacterium sp. OR-4]
MNIVRRHVSILLLAAAALASGCASLPSPEVMKKEIASFQLPKLPEEGQAIVYVVRPSPLGTLVRFNVFLDDQEASSEMGYTRGSQYIYFNLKPGDHKIYSKAENWAESLVSVKAGEVIFIQQDTTMGVVMARNALQQLEEVTGKYQVKMATVGTILKTDK